MAGRVAGKYKAICTPVGNIPKYEDISALYSSHLNKQYSEEQYHEQFSIRTAKLLGKLSRIEAIYRAEQGVPDLLFLEITTEKERLQKARKEFGETILPEAFQEIS